MTDPAAAKYVEQVATGLEGVTAVVKEAVTTAYEGALDVFRQTAIDRAGALMVNVVEEWDKDTDEDTVATVTVGIALMLGAVLHAGGATVTVTELYEKGYDHLKDQVQALFDKVKENAE